ncbi:glycosyltransferase family 2 protein [Salinirubrum litoreum]|uniref:Glycosyltransferase family 2 protein n=1 Tax=Salinirubrum litoreum TaxID=1126234 RepID=A0ABD5RFR5_9EURY|nr:glycosyltransferase family 2 protein [Salinirubrum litoreum]
MYRNHRVAVVVPAYNESGFVGDVLRGMPDYVDLVIAVDDDSTDDTWAEILTTAAETEPTAETATAVARHPDAPATPLTERATVSDRVGRVLPVQHRENQGAGGAIKTGYMAAVERQVDLIVTVDGDGQMDLSIMTRFLDPLIDGGAGYAKGNRLLYREFREQMPRFRFVGNLTLTFLTKIASGYWRMMDPQNGYTAISRDALVAIDLDDLYEYYGYCNDLLVKLNVAGVRIADVPMPARYGEEQSSIKYGTYIRRVSLMLLWNFLWRINAEFRSGRTLPTLAGYYLGAGLTGASLPLLLWTALPLAGVGVPAPPSPVSGLLSAVLAVLLGGGLLVAAMTLDRARNRPLEVQPSP